MKQVNGAKIESGGMADVPKFYASPTNTPRTSRLYGVTLGSRMPRITEVLSGVVKANSLGTIDTSIVFTNLIYKQPPLVVGIFTDAFTTKSFPISGGTTLGIGTITASTVQLVNQFSAVANGSYPYRLRVYNLDL